MNKTIKRSLSLLLAIVMILGLGVSASAEPTTLASGDKVLNDCFEVTANPSTNGWTVSGTGADTVLSDTNTGTTQKILQLKNLMEERTLTLDYTTSGNATIQIKIGSASYPTAATGSGSWEGRIPAGETVYFRETKKGTVTISNIRFDPDETAVNVTFEPAEHGTYTVDGVAITESKTIEKTTLESYALSATPEEGYEFVGWYDLTNGTTLSTSQEYTLSVLSDVSVTAVFARPAAEDGTFSVDGRYYDSFDDAVSYALGAGKDTVVLVKDYTLTEDVTVPAGITLLIPYNDAHTCFTNDFEVNGQHPSVTNSYSTPSPYKTLTVASGATLTVNGKLSVSGQHYASSGGNKYYGPSGPCGYVELQGGAQLVVNGGLYAYGYVYGPGSVTVNSGAEVYELMQIAGFRGGTATLAMAQDSRKVFPLSQYYVQNVESPMTLNAGAVEYVATSLKPGGESAITAAVPFIHPTSGMFRMSEGTLVKTYDGSTDRLDLDVNGVGSINSLVVDVPGVTSVDSSNFVLPITSNISINVYGGSIALGQDIAFLPGTQVNVAEGATVEVEEGHKVYVYDRDEWVKDGNYFSYETGNAKTRLNPILYAVTKGYTRTEADLVDALVTVDGTMVVKGEAYTTESGAEIITNNHKGLVVFEADAGTDTETYQYDQSKLINRYVSINIDPVRLCNDTNTQTPYTETTDAVAGNTYGWSEAKNMWVKGLLLSFDANGGEGTMDPQFMEIVGGETADVIQANTFTRDGFRFVGWSLTPEDEAMYAIEGDDETNYFYGNEDGNFINTTLYATWEAVAQHDVTWIDGDDNELAVIKVNDGERPVYNGETPTKTSTVESDFIFAGWTDGTTNYGLNDELPAVTAPITYTAVFTATPRTYRVSYNANGGQGSMAPEFDTYGNTHTLAENSFTYSGYEFAGWNTEANGSGASYADKASVTITGDLTLYAQWSAKMVTVRFLNDDDVNTVLYTAQVQQGTSPTYGGETPSKAPDTYYNYAFAGWKLGENRYSKDSLLPPVEDDTDFVAYYTATKRTYTVRFDPKGGYFQGTYQNFGNQVTDPIYCEAGTNVTTAVVMKNGSTFQGWSTKSDLSGPLVDANAQYAVLENTVFYAVWQVNTHTVTFLPGADDAQGSMDPMTFEFGQTKTLTANAFTRNGYAFAGWLDQYGNPFSDGQSVTYTYNEDLTLTAQWEKVSVEYKVTFDPKGGTGFPEGMEEFSIEENESFPLPTCEKTGHTLQWKDTETNELYDPETEYTVTKDVDFVAVWTPIPYTITWVVEGTSTEETYNYGDTPVYKENDIPTSPTKADDELYTYTFTRWDPSIEEVTSDKTYTAQFTGTPIPHMVTFDANAPEGTTAEGTMEPLTINGVEYTTLTANAFTVTGYHFTGWQDQNGKTYADKDPVKATEDLTLSAQWEINTYTITWKDDEGQTIDTTTVEHGTVPTHEDASKASTAEWTYTFAGWDPEPVAATEDATYKATFTATTRTYTITWMLDADTEIDTTTVAYGVVPTHADASKEATAEWTYTFAGWTPDVVAVTGDATYTATFNQTKNSYTITWMLDADTEIDKTTVEYGVVPTHADAVKANTAEWTYTFTGWTPEVVAVTGDATYTAQFDQTKNSYTITFYDEGGTVLESKLWEYGETPSYDTSKLSKPEDEQYTYEFDHWNPAVVAVTGDADYTAVYQGTLRKYSVTWQNWNGDLLLGEDLDYGTIPSYSGGEPGKTGNAQFSYVHNGWTDGITNYSLEDTLPAVHGDVTYTATFEEVTNTYTVHWVVEGVEVETDENVPYGTMPEYNGETPTKAADAEFTYEFDTWYPVLAEVTDDVTYTAVFKKTTNTYTVHWIVNGEEVETDENVPYGTTPSYDGETPTKEATAQYEYEFTGWDPALTSDTIVNGNMTFVAQFSETLRSYTITFVNYDGTPLDTQTVAYGETPEYAGETPERAADAQYTYSFSGWDPAVEQVKGDQTYTATYSTTVNKYTVTWVNWDGETLETDLNVPYGDKPNYDGTEPTREQSNTTVYTFSGWYPAITDETIVTGDQTYTAQFTESVRKYTVKYVNDDGTELQSFEVEYEAEVPMYTGEVPTKASTDQYRYEFAGFAPAITADTKVTSDMTFTAQYEKYTRTYTITWVVGTETTTAIYEYGAMPSYKNGATPTMPSTDQYDYTFTVWSPAIEMVTGDQTYTAQFSESLRSYTVTWMNGDTVFKTESVAYGTVPTDPNENPARTAGENEEGTYTFSAWTPERAAVEGEQTYYAVFTFTGWRWDEIGKQYFIADALQKTGFTKIGDYYYYLDPETGYAAVNAVVSIDESDPGHAFDADGKWMEGCPEQVFTDENSGDIYLIENGIVEVFRGLYRTENSEYYYFGEDNKAYRGEVKWVEKNHATDNNPRGMLPKWDYTFGDDGIIVHEDVDLDGIVNVDGVKYYYIDGIRVHYGMFYQDGYYYYADRNGKLITGKTYWCTDNYDTGFKAGPYTFDDEGRMINVPRKTGFYFEDNSIFYYVDGNRFYAGLMLVDDEHPVNVYEVNDNGEAVLKGKAENGYYYVRTEGELAHSRNYWTTKTNGLLTEKTYRFDENGKIDFRTGIYEEDGSLWYYKDGLRYYAGLIEIDGDYYYVKTSGEVVHGQKYWISKTNGLLPEKSYEFADDGKMIVDVPTNGEGKNGIVEENGGLWYYVDGKLTYAGLIEIDGDYYYVKTSGEVVHGQKYWITKTNGLMPEGSYTFAEDGKMILD